MTLILTSSAFLHNGTIPAKYTCDGDRSLSPPLAIAGVPEGTKSLVLIMDDPDVPKVLRPDGVFDHWMLFNIPPETRGIPEGSSVGEPGVTTRGEPHYIGPCPPPEYEPREHRYVFKLYALSGTLSFSAPPTAALARAMLAPHLVAEAELIGRYTRK